MALTDKNIVITPSIGQTADPKIVFSGADSTTGPQNITLNVYPNNSGTVSFEASSGQLLSVSNDMTGYIFSANDISGIPSIDAHADGTVRLAPYGGTVYAGNGTSGLGVVPPVWTYRRINAGAAIGAAIADVFTTPSSLSLEASSVYQIKGKLYFLKTTAGTGVWTNTFSSAPVLFEGFSRQTAITGMVAATGAVYTPLLNYYYAQGAVSVATAATGSLSTAVNHNLAFEFTVITNAATNWRLRLTQSAGTATPLAGSYYTVTKIGLTTGNFVA